FQAEDGIRDRNVTGVQTCALPIFARAARAGGAHTVGVIPAHLVPLEVADVDADELIVVETMRERKQLMDERSDAFLALPGGIGRSEERRVGKECGCRG